MSYTLTGVRLPDSNGIVHITSVEVPGASATGKITESTFPETWTQIAAAGPFVATCNESGLRVFHTKTMKMMYTNLMRGSGGFYILRYTDTTILYADFERTCVTEAVLLGSKNEICLTTTLQVPKVLCADARDGYLWALSEQGGVYVGHGSHKIVPGVITQLAPSCKAMSILVCLGGTQAIVMAREEETGLIVHMRAIADLTEGRVIVRVASSGKASGINEAFHNNRHHVVRGVGCLALLAQTADGSQVMVVMSANLDAPNTVRVAHELMPIERMTALLNEPLDTLVVHSVHYDRTTGIRVSFECNSIMFGVVHVPHNGPTVLEAAHVGLVKNPLLSVVLTPCPIITMDPLASGMTLVSVELANRLLGQLNQKVQFCAELVRKGARSESGSSFTRGVVENLREEIDRLTKEVDTSRIAADAAVLERDAMRLTLNQANKQLQEVAKKLEGVQARAKTQAKELKDKVKEKARADAAALEFDRVIQSHKAGMRAVEKEKVDLLRAHETALKAKDDAHAAELKRKDDALKTLMQAKDDVRAELLRVRQAEQNRHEEDAKTASLTRGHAAALAAALAAQEETHAAALRLQEETHAAALAAQKERHAAALATQKETHTAALAAALAAQEETHAAALAAQKETHAAAMAAALAAQEGTAARGSSAAAVEQSSPRTTPDVLLAEMKGLNIALSVKTQELRRLTDYVLPGMTTRLNATMIANEELTRANDFWRNFLEQARLPNGIPAEMAWSQLPQLFAFQMQISKAETLITQLKTEIEQLKTETEQLKTETETMRASATSASDVASNEDNRE